MRSTRALISPPAARGFHSLQRFPSSSPRHGLRVGHKSMLTCTSPIHSVMPSVAHSTPISTCHPDPLNHLVLSVEILIMAQYFNKSAWEGFVGAVDAARQFKNQAVESEHLMKALLEQKDGTAQRILTKAGIDNTTVLQHTDNFIAGQPKVIGDNSVSIVGSSLTNLLDNAKKHKEDMCDGFLSVEHFMLASYLDKRFGEQLFKNLQISEKDLKDAIIAARGRQRVTYQNPEGKYDALAKKYWWDITDFAKRNPLDHVIGGDDEIQRCIHILSRRTKNIPVIIGEPSVENTDIVEGLAQRIVRGDVPEPLLNTKIIKLHMYSLIDDAKYHGDFEERLKAVLKVFAASNVQIIFIIDESHTEFVGATSEATGAVNMLNPMIGRGKLRCIWATTLTKYRTPRWSVDFSRCIVSGILLKTPYTSSVDFVRTPRRIFMLEYRILLWFRLQFCRTGMRGNSF